MALRAAGVDAVGVNVFCVRPRRFNVGNETIDLAMRLLLREELGTEVNLVPVPAVESDEEGSLSGLGARVVHEMNLYGHGVVVGGGNLYENGQLDIDVHALSHLRPPLFLCGLSHGRIYDQRGRLTQRTDSMPDAMITALNQRAGRSLVRDSATLEHLHGLGLTDAKLGGCPTLLLADLLADRLPQAPARDAGALISIRDPQLMSIPLAARARVHSDVRRIIDALEDAGYGPVRLLCHDKRDMAFASTFRGVAYILPDDVLAYLELLRSAPLNVSFRLHASLPCFGFGTPAVNISYDERALSLMETIGLGKWDVNLIRDEGDVVETVMDRIGHLAELDSLKTSAEPTLRHLGGVIRTAVADFAADTRDYQAANAA